MNTPTTTNPMRLLVSFNKLEVDGNQELHTGSNTNGTNYEVFLQYHTAKVGEMCRVTTDGESKLRFQLEHRVERTENSSGRYAIIDTLKQNNPRSLNTNKSNSHRGQVAVVTLDARGCPIACRMEGRIGETIDDWFKVPESGGSERVSKRGTRSFFHWKRVIRPANLPWNPSYGYEVGIHRQTDMSVSILVYGSQMSEGILAEAHAEEKVTYLTIYQELISRDKNNFSATLSHLVVCMTILILNPDILPVSWD